MSSRTLVGLLAAIAVLVALAVAVSFSQRTTTGSGLLLPGFMEQINEVRKITLRTGGDKTIATLVRGESGWEVAERHGYPADVGRIRKNLIALAEARILEEKTSNPELYDRLKVDDIEKPAAAGVRLDLETAAGPTSVIVGDTGVGGGERAYARRAGETTSWLVSGNFDLPRETAEWLDQSLIDIDAGRVHAVSITHPDGATVRVEKETPGAVDFTVRDVPRGRELSYPGVGNPIGAALADLRLEDVEPAADFAPGDVEPTVARFETFDGLVVSVSTYRTPSGPRLRFAASADAALAKRFAPPAPADAAASAPGSAAAASADGTAATEAAGPPEPAVPAAAQKPFAEVQAEAEELGARLGNWVYSIPDFKAEQLTRKLEDLLQPKSPQN